MTTALQKQSINPSWPVEKIREAAACFAGMMISDKLSLFQQSPEEIEALSRESAQKRAELFKSKGVKSPMDLVRHMAEFEVNLGLMRHQIPPAGCTDTAGPG